MKEGKFLYAIVESEGDSRLDFAGLDGAPLETVPYRDLAAVISHIDTERLECTDEERLKADMVRYQQVNTALMKICTVVPMRFGFTARDGQHVEEVLRKVYLQLRTLLYRLRGKVELVVQASWDLPKVLDEIAREQVSLPYTKGYRDSDEVIKIGRVLFEAAAIVKDQLIEDIHSRLLSSALDCSDGPLKSENMILNRSYLVEKDKEPLFDKAISHLAAEHDGRLTFRYIGPLPAYSFTNVDFERGNFAEVDWARKVLRLPSRATWCMVKESYRSLILANHPDMNPDGDKAEERCKEAINAYEILEAYCKSFESSRPGKADLQYSFAKEDVEEVFIMKSRGECLYGSI